MDFLKHFNVILNGLDNLDARWHVNWKCLATNVPLIESDTTGFFLNKFVGLAVYFVENNPFVIRAIFFM